MSTEKRSKVWGNGRSDIGYVVVVAVVIWLLMNVRCSSPTSTEEDCIGLHWDEFAHTTWYIEDGDGLALERWRFYADSLVADIDHFKFENGQRVVTSRSRQLAKVYTKDMMYDYWVDGKIIKHRATELQWKTMWPSLIDPQIWTAVFDWSVYQFWCIEWSTTRTACVGNVPYCYQIQTDVPFELTYNKGWIYDEMK